MTSNFGVKNGAWLARSNGERLNLQIDTSDHADPMWRADQVAISEESAITLYLKTLTDDLAERIFYWGKNKILEKGE